jgi:hypothetical protein
VSLHRVELLARERLQPGVEVDAARVLFAKRLTAGDAGLRYSSGQRLQSSPSSSRKRFEQGEVAQRLCRNVLLNPGRVFEAAYFAFLTAW